MKKTILFFAMAAMSVMAMAQAKKPTVMVVPSDAWCIKNGYGQTVDVMDKATFVPDYRMAFQQNMDLKLAVAKLGELMADRGFPLENLEQTLKQIDLENAEQMVISSKNGNEMAETALDQINRTARPDIIMELSWEVQQQGPKRTLTYILSGLDAYTNKQVAAASGHSTPSMAADVTTLLEEAVVANLDAFNNQLQTHFEDMAENGREVIVEFRVFDNNAAGIDLESEFGDEELIDILKMWFQQNTVKHRFTTGAYTETRARFNQVRIPLYNANEMAIDATDFVKPLTKMLKKEPYNIPSKVSSRGLGRVMVILGEK